MKNCALILLFAFFSLPFASQAQQTSYATTQPISSVYVDMGILYGSYAAGNLISWWPEPVNIDQTKYDQYLSIFFTALKSKGVNEVKLAFAQLCDINALQKSQMGPSNADTITQIFKDNYFVGNTKNNFLNYFNTKAHTYGLKVGLSFGGQNAQSSDMKFNGDAATQAQNLAIFLKSYNFDSVDFDIEGANVTALLTQNSTSSVLTFFQTLHKNITPSIQSYLTLEGALLGGPTGTLSFLFNSFHTQFDGVNLMLYSTEQYYIDTNDVTWGINQWLQYVPNNQLHIGFYDKIPYESSSSSAGNIYNIPKNSTRGQAAGFIYKTLWNQLTTTFLKAGQPFWWTDDPTTLPNNNVIADFSNYLKQ